MHTSCLCRLALHSAALQACEDAGQASATCDVEHAAVLLLLCSLKVGTPIGPLNTCLDAALRARHLAQCLHQTQLSHGVFEPAIHGTV